MQRMNMAWLVPLAIVVLASSAGAATIWDESVDGDLSSSEAAPTSLTLQAGSNVITGTMGGPDTRDYVTFTLDPGELLIGLNLLDYTDVASGNVGNRGFHAINLGATSFIPSGGTAGLFLGGDHLDPAPVGTDLLPDLAAAPLAGTGFTIPLGPDTYSYLVQQTGPQVTAYSIELVVAPEPSLLLLVTWGLSSLALARRRSTRIRGV